MFNTTDRIESLELRYKNTEAQLQTHVRNIDRVESVLVLLLRHFDLEVKPAERTLGKRGEKK